ncbi:fatty-acid--CoA ligase [Rubrobacter taiwanensis]|jgi:fatty-acyl-CoA synthase|uniref:Fatty-acid--CoA ligase n=1 Tax=Rubrobacter taiwanensis TaxID=185139 RepID=A0A4V2NVU4_9ACTN|nr:long-chain fatty acid--CoA ligase [Rubrobacter taiwanensis]TCJ14832.1 fatty-acid--CoA ligase [Rubrobacter taiwanensis]
MNGLMMDYQLTLPAILRRAETYFWWREVTTQLPDFTYHRYTYADFARRAKKLAVALGELGVESGDRVATLAWNHHRHFEAFFGIPASGGVLHALNMRLRPDDLAYIVEHAQDKIVIVDEDFLPLLDRVRERVDVERVIVISRDGSVPEGMLDYEELLESADEERFEYPDFDEGQAAALCYTSGTTGRPKGVLYSHRSLVLQAMTWTMADTAGIRQSDVIYPIVPMFHINNWCQPFVAAMVGARFLFAKPHFDAARLLKTIEEEKVTLSGGVPTVWLSILQELERNPGQYDLSGLRGVIVAGAAAPKGMIKRLKEDYGVEVIHMWGLTETAPLATVAAVPADMQDAPADEKYALLSRQGYPIPFIEMRLRGAEGFAPWDGETMGELELRGPWVASAYYENPEAADRFTEDGWFRTGDVMTIDERGCLELQDRTKDLVKSGGEWISSVALENALMGHPAVAEAAVIAVPHPKWQERPLGIVVLKEGQSATPEELIDFIRPEFPKWWLPDAIEFVDEIPRTPAGKFLKRALRERFKDYQLA